MMRRLFTGFCFLLLTCGFVGAEPLDPAKLPAELRPWVDWVLRGSENRICPFLYNTAEERICAWPARLELALDERRGEFRMQWSVQAESWVPLPGAAVLWPQEVRVDGKPGRVMARAGAPAILLAPGNHIINGQLPWDRIPESLPVPRSSGLIALSIQGRAVATPSFNEQGQLWLEGAGARSGQGTEVVDRLEVQVFRQLLDDIPFQLVTHLDLDVSGESREVLLSGALPANFVGMSLRSALPARLENDGRLRLQLRPGRWEVELTARHAGPVDALALPQSSAPWPPEEIWSFQARPQLRVVELEGVTSLDPNQTNLPEVWRNLPAYRVAAGDTVSFRLIQRGDPEPEPDALNLQRNLWLDFDGRGFTVSDEINGRMTRDWRLSVLGGQQLGRVAIDGTPQLITRLSEKGPPGVEVRRGNLRLAADSRMQGDVWRFPATGWDKDFRSVAAQLHLPPGWRLFTATGVDNVPDAWVNRWTLLDLFLVLIASLAVARLWNGWLGLLALATLTLLWHEPGAPRLVWLNLLAAIALLRVLPAGKLAVFCKGYAALALLGLVFISLPFMTEQIRTAIYPQLELPWTSVTAPQAESADAAGGASLEEAADAVAPVMAPAPAPLARKRGPLSEYGSDYASERFDEIDPSAVTQTGPGLPQWRWKTVTLSWNGPVTQEQEVGLWLISPALELLLKFLRVAALSGLALLLLTEVLPGFPAGRFRAARPGAGLSLFFGAALLAGGHAPPARADFPPQALLDELKANLTQAPDCLPDCAQIPLLKLRADGEILQQELEVHAQQGVAVPLPAQEGQWLPARINVDGAPAEGVRRTAEGGLWLYLAPGRHLVALSGELPAREQLQIPLPLRPHRVELGMNGWTVSGMGPHGVPEAQLQLSRVRKTAGTAAAALEPLPLPAFLEVQRTLRIGLDWRVTTRVQRLTPADAPAVAAVPLLEGESVLSQGLQVRNGVIAVSLVPGQQELQWESMLQKRPQIVLRAPDTTQWTEVWKLDLSPIWHVQSEGIAVVHQLDSAGNWLPEWRPWPGESVSLNVSRPEAVAGKSLTIESSRLQLSPGKRASESSLSLDLRSSQGGQHVIRLPEGALLQSVSLDGQSRPIRLQDGAVTLPIHPGRQSAALVWREEADLGERFTVAAVNLGLPSVNSFITVHLPQDRWILLTGGPRLGPAVLFWGVLVVIGMVALGLGRISLTPLKSWQWALLLLGLSQVPLPGAVCVIAWLVLLGWRGRTAAALDDSRFNVLQLLLGLLTLAALLFLFYAVQQGLLGLPDMQVAGNSSDAYTLNWYQDQSEASLPQPWVLTAPLWVYRVLMLLWALWLAYSLLNWLRWGWACFTAGGLWRARPEKAAPPPSQPGWSEPE